MKSLLSAIGLVCTLSAGAAIAAPVSPISYDIPNGGSGSFNYWDDSYTGSGSKTTDGAALTGGLGDLTDGYIETALWLTVEGPGGANGPNVGWLGINPILTFRFDQAYQFSAITFYLEHDLSAGIGAPSSVTVNGENQAIATPSGDVRFAFEFDASNLAPTDTLAMQLFRTRAFIFASEITFETAAPAVPLPAGGILLLSSLGLLALRRRAKST